MISFLLASQNLPFTVALCVMIAIAFLEGTSLFLGAGLVNVFDKMIPMIDFDGVDAPDVSNTSGLTKILSWLRIGKVPILITLIIFLTLFGLGGLILQSFAAGISGSLLPAWVAAAPVFAVSLPILRVSHSVVEKMIPKDETYAVSEETFIGRIAVITAGTATGARAAEARLKDEFGRDHYVMVKPDNEGETFPPGDQVLLVAKKGAFFHAIENPNPNLVDPTS